jgi:hypothetical protein
MLEPIEYYKGSKNAHPTVLCRCSCGNTRVVRQTRLRRGLVTMCAKCAKAEAAIKGASTRRRFTEEEIAMRNKRSEYKQNAKRRGIAFLLGQDEFGVIVSELCRYCGTRNGVGVDRLDNLKGYTRENSVPCCDKCNYAKRDMTETEFLNLVERIHAHQSR